MGRPTVLLVEDEPAVRELVADVLGDKGYDVVEAQSGVEAIRTLDEHRPQPGELSLIVLDMMLPGMDGLEVLGHMDSLGVSVPVVATSVSRALLAAAADAGACAVLRKPFDLNELLEVVAGHCTPCDQAPTSAAVGVLV
jgi:two-component system, chemotaxis family, chemotaxis protein CheY